MVSTPYREHAARERRCEACGKRLVEGRDPGQVCELCAWRRATILAERAREASPAATRGGPPSPLSPSARTSLALGFLASGPLTTWTLTMSPGAFTREHVFYVPLMFLGPTLLGIVACVAVLHDSWTVRPRRVVAQVIAVVVGCLALGVALYGLYGLLALVFHGPG